MNSPLKTSEMLRPQPYRFAAAEFLGMIEAGLLAGCYVELVNGELVELPPPSPRHGRFQANAIALLNAAFADIRDLWVSGDTAILISGNTVIGCDAVVASGPDDANALDGSQIILAVEVSVSTIGYDLGSKVPLYERAGVETLWIIDPEASVIHSFADLEEGSYRQRSVVRFGEPLPVPGTDRTIIID